jgi:hypothetical protein
MTIEPHDIEKSVIEPAITDADKKKLLEHFGVLVDTMASLGVHNVELQALNTRKSGARVTILLERPK